ETGFAGTLAEPIRGEKLASYLFFHRRKLHKYRIWREFRVGYALLLQLYLDLDGARRVSRMCKSHAERRAAGYLHGTRRLTAGAERSLRYRTFRIGIKIDGPDKNRGFR